MKKDRKDSLLTIRITDDEKHALDFLSDQTGKSKSDAIIRACKYFVNWDCDPTVSDTECIGLVKDRKKHQVHCRMTQSDVEQIDAKSREAGVTTSQIIRKAIREYARVVRRSY